MSRCRTVNVGSSGKELVPSGALEVFTRREAQKGSTVATGVEYEKGMGGGVTREREQDGAWARCSSGRGGDGMTGLS